MKLRTQITKSTIGKIQEADTCRTEYVFGVPVTCCSVDYVLREMDSNIRGRRERRCISITNTESMYHAKRIPSHLRYIENATFSFCDGIGGVIAARFVGKRVWRLNGPVLMLKCCEYGVERGWRHFFYGARDGVAELLSDKLMQRFPGMITAGTYCPPFRHLGEKEDKEIVEKINAYKPDILWVGLGLLKQERWISEHIDEINVPWMIGVGAAFDYHAGTQSWAPKWVQRIGMEWLYRLCLQPRMLKRNVRSAVFLLQSIKQSLVR